MMKIMSKDGEVKFESSKFPGGEVHVKISRTVIDAHIYALLKSSDDILRLLLVTDALRRNGAETISLGIPYLPYARQDRICHDGESLSIKVMCNLINSQKYSRVIVSDAHSNVSLALIDNVVHLEPTLDDIYFNNCVLVAPDSGAVKRTEKIAESIHAKFVRADKKRSEDNWEVTVYSGHIGDKDFLIVDDICDGGRTFVELSKKLRPLTNGNINLYVTHGIFSKGMSVFEGLIDKIYCIYPWVCEDIFEKEGFFDVKKRIVK